jgi:hypothetical protein
LDVFNTVDIQYSQRSMRAVRENLPGRKKRKKNSWNNPSQHYYCDLKAQLRTNLITI